MSERLESGTFKDPTRLTNWTKWFLYVQFGLLLVNLIWSVSELRLVTQWRQDGVLTPGQLLAVLEANRDRHRVLRVAEIVAVIATAVLTLTWIYRANANCHRLGSFGMRFSPGWAVGWFFVPVANLWKPLQVMKEIWAASAPQEWHDQPSATIVHWWWGLFVTALLVGLLPLLFLVSTKRGFVPVYVLSSKLSGLIVAILCLVMAALVGRICEMQLSHSTRDRR